MRRNQDTIPDHARVAVARRSIERGDLDTDEVKDATVAAVFRELSGIDDDKREVLKT